MCPRFQRIPRPFVSRKWLSLLCLPAFHFAKADTLTWDVNTGLTGAQDGAGTWTTGAGNWRNVTNPADNQVWVNGGIAQFGAGTAANGSNITVDGAGVNVGGVNFLALTAAPATQAYRFSGGVINLASGAVINLADNTTTSGAFVAFANVISGNDITIQKSDLSLNQQFIEFGAANTWTGTLTINDPNAATLGAAARGVFVRITNPASLNSLTNVVVGNGNTVNLQLANSTYTSNFTIAGTGNDGGRGAIRFDSNMTLSGKITLSGDAALNTQNSINIPSTVTLTQGIGETGGARVFTKTGVGTLIMQGASDYTGNTIVGVNGGTTNGGTLVLDFANSATTTDLLYNGVTKGALSLAGNVAVPFTGSVATLSLTGKAGTANTQTFSATTVKGPTRIMAASGSGGSTNLTLGTITRDTSTAGTVLDMVGPASGNIFASNSGFLGTWATYTGSSNGGWASVTAGTVGVFNAELVYTAGTNISALAGYSGTSNLGITSASTGDVQQAAGSTAIGTVSMADTTARTIAMGSGKTLNLGAGGGIQIQGNAANLTVGSAPNVGTFTAGTAANAEMYLTNMSATSTLTINSVLGNNGGGAVNVYLNGTGTTVFAGANTYTGTTRIYSGALEIRNNAALGTTAGSTIVGAGAALQLAENVSLMEALSLNGVGVSAGGALRNISGSNTQRGLITLGSEARINADANSRLTIDVVSGNAMSGAFNIVFGGAGEITVADPIATGAGTVTKDGTGTLTLTATNTYTGATTISGGILEIQNAGALGTVAAGTSVSSGATLQLSGGITTLAEGLTLNGTGLTNRGALRNASGNNTYAGAITIGSATRINSDAGTLTLDVATGNGITGSNQSLTLGGHGNIAVADAITTGTGTLTKDGTGAVTLSGANTFAGTVTVNNGSLVLDYANVDPLTSANNFSVMNGTVTFKGKSTGTTADTVGTIAMQNYSTTKIVVDNNGGAGTTITTGNWTFQAGTVNFFVDLSSGGALKTSAPLAGVALTNNVLMVGDRAVVIVKDATGTGFGTQDVGNNILRYTGATALTATSSQSSGTANYIMNASVDHSAAAFDFSTLQIDTGNTVSAGSVDLNLGTRQLLTGAAGRAILATGVNESKIVGTGTFGGGSLYVTNHSTGAMTIDMNIGGAPLVSNGSGLVIYTKAAAQDLYVEGGILRLTANSAYASGVVRLSGGGVLELAADLNGSALGDFDRVVGGASTSSVNLFGDSGFSAKGANRVVALGGVAAPTALTWGAGSFLTTSAGTIDGDYALKFGSAYSDATLEFANAIDFNGKNRVIDVADGTSNSNVDARLTGALTSATGGFVKTGAGMLELTNNLNTYSGATTVSAGTLLASNSGGSATGAGNVTVLSGARLGGTGIIGTTTNAVNVNVNSGAILMVGATHGATNLQGGTFADLELKTSNAGVISLNGTLQFDIFANSNNGGLNPLSSNDLLKVSSDQTVILTGTLSLLNSSTDLTSSWTANSSWQLFDWSEVDATTKVSGTFTTFELPDLATLSTGLSWDVSKLYTTGFISIVPEPSRALLMLGGLMALTLRRRRTSAVALAS